MTAFYVPRSRAERLIAAGRVGLLAVGLLAIWMEPPDLAIAPWTAIALSSGYVVCALLLLLKVWGSPAPVGGMPLLGHAFDLVAFCLVVLFAGSAAGPVFLYAAFPLASATLRWLWRGTLWTAGAVLAAYVGFSLLAPRAVGGPAVELRQIIVHGLYLLVLATLLACLGAYEEWMRGKLSGLAAWPRTIPREAPALVRDLLEHAAGLLRAPRILMSWDEPEEPWFHLASWSRGEFQWNRQPPGTYEPLVPEPLGGTDFFCPDAGLAMPTVLHTSPAGLQRRQGAALHAELQARFAIGAVLCLRLHGEVVRGRLFALDGPGMTADDLALGEIVARQMAARMDQLYLLQRLQQAAATEERIRLARQLHDGVLQSLTGAALQLQAVGSLLQADGQAARDRLLEIQRLLAEEQRDLRFFIQELKPAPLWLPGANSSLAARLKELGERIERHWGLRVDLAVEPPTAPIAEPLLREIYLIVHEALVNAARHAQASTARVTVRVLEGEMRIAVADNGRGFRFRGRYDHAALTDLKLGPVTLKERILALRGSLAIESSDSGARLEISLPLPPPGA
jgi:signal transduction histidine kinase